MHELGHFEHYNRVRTDIYGYTLEYDGATWSKNLSLVDSRIAERIKRALAYVEEHHGQANSGTTS